MSKPIKLGEIADRKLVRATLEHFEKQISGYGVENAVVITDANEVYRCVGDKNGVTSILDLGNKLRGASVTHNHPIGSSNEYSFSKFDIDMFMNYGLKFLRGIDEKFVYELNRNASDLDMDNFSIEDLMNNPAGSMSRHIAVIKKAKELGIGYRRWSR